jgi:hypothetical protein
MLFTSYSSSRYSAAGFFVLLKIMKILYRYFLLLLLSTAPFLMRAQLLQTGISHSLIQFSGVVVDADSLKPVPFASIVIRSTNRGTISDYFGYFSFVAQKGDTIDFNSIGFKRSTFVIPDTLTINKYSLIQVLRSDTILLKETVIYPWPTKEQFREAFLQLQIPDDDLERARKNLAQAEMKDKMNGLAMDGSMNFRNKMQQQQSRLYYAGQLPPNNLLNPIAWAKFIQAWKNGDFKRQ